MSRVAEEKAQRRMLTPDNEAQQILERLRPRDARLFGAQRGGADRRASKSAS